MFFFIFLFAAAFNLIGCAHTPADYDDLTGICALDFETGKCWVEKSKNNGYDFGELRLQNSRCDSGPPDFCWFAINHVALTKLLRANERLKDSEGE